MTPGFIAVLIAHSAFLCLRVCFVLLFAVELPPFLKGVSLVLIALCLILTWVPRPVGRVAGIAYHFLEVIFSTVGAIVSAFSFATAMGAGVVALLWGAYFLRGKGPRRAYGSLACLWRRELEPEEKQVTTLTGITE